ncbi:hypothetical protein AAMO2058_000490900 [Amorphochlora amoebiformis]
MVSNPALSEFALAFSTPTKARKSNSFVKTLWFLTCDRGTRTEKRGRLEVSPRLSLPIPASRFAKVNITCQTTLSEHLCLKAGEWEERRNSYAKAFEPATDILNTKMTVQDFELLKVVGKGSFGKVYQVKHKATGKIYALKSLKKQQLLKRKQIAHTNTERKVLQNIESPFIVNLKFAFQSKDRLYLGLEYFTGGELFYHLKTGGRFGYSRARFYGMEICMALECLHDNGIIYRDLKPENLLLDDEGHIRLTDFGLSKDCILGNQETKTFCGTPEYLDVTCHRHEMQAKDAAKTCTPESLTAE